MINTYLTFSGNCREAMTFYKDCLGGELMLQTVGDSPLAERLPKQMKECILQASLSNSNFVLMGSDMVPDAGLIKGNAVSLSLNCSSEDEIKRCYEKLAEGGKREHPLENTFWGALFGDVTDKYGNHWLLNYERKEKVVIR